MATVFMRWLETRPGDYDRGIRLLTLGRLRPLKERIAQQHIREGMRVLEIGCGTGALTALMAARGAAVTAIDASPAMLAKARQKVAASGSPVTFVQMDATSVGDRFPAGSFDLIVATLFLGELGLEAQQVVLDACAPLLAPGGRLLIADEVVPSGTAARLLYTLVRWPLVLLTWLLTRTTSAPLRDLEGLLSRAGFKASQVCAALGGSLVLYQASPTDEATVARPRAVRLRHQVTLRTLLIDLWAAFFRILPPYPKVKPGLYAVGRPGPDSPVLVTGNFDLTVRRLVRAIDGQVDAWLLVADSAGINVWCAAGGGYLTAERIVAAAKAAGLDGLVSHRALVLPQLCANGVDGRRLREATGWQVHWGPVRASDIPAYLAAGRRKTDAMRWVRFPLRDRLEMVTVTLGFYGLLILLPILVFWRHLFWPATISLVSLSYSYAVVEPWLPGRDGLAKSVPMTLIALTGLLVYTAVWDPAPVPQLFGRAMGITALSFFCTAEMQGMSPLMRGEQANWGWEAVVGAAMALTYWLVPLALGWR